LGRASRHTAAGGRSRSSIGSRSGATAPTSSKLRFGPSCARLPPTPVSGCGRRTRGSWLHASR